MPSWTRASATGAKRNVFVKPPGVGVVVGVDETGVDVLVVVGVVVVADVLVGVDEAGVVVLVGVAETGVAVGVVVVPLYST